MAAGARGDSSKEWLHQNLQLPRELGKRFREVSAQEGFGGVKLVGATAVATFLALPEEIRDELLGWALLTARRRPNDITPEGASECLRDALIKMSESTDEDRSGWHVARILDPELTPPPGAKESDHSGSTRRAG